MEICSHCCRHQSFQASVLLVPKGTAVGFVHCLHHLPHAVLILKGREVTRREHNPPQGQELMLAFTTHFL